MKFGVIGTNFVSDMFMEGAAFNPECEVAAVCSKRAERAKAFQEKYGIAIAMTDYKEMANHDLVDAVYIAVPNSLHFEIAKYFLERKFPVFCEKPLCSNAKEVHQLIALAKQNDVYLQEGLVPLYLPNFKLVKEKLSLAGKIRQVNVNFSKYSSRYDAYLRNENPTTFQNELSNGATMDLGVYCVGVVVGLFGKPKRIFSTASLIETKVDVSGSSLFEYDDFVVTLSYSKVCDAAPLLEICGEKGTLRVDHPSRFAAVTFNDRKTETSIGLPKIHSFAYQISEMISQLNAGEKEALSVPLSLSTDIHEVLTEMRRQSKIVYPADY